MKAEDLKTKTEDELKKLLLEQRKTLFNLRFQQTNGTLEKTDAIGKARKTVARIKTFLTHKRKEEAKQGKKAA